MQKQEQLLNSSLSQARVSEMLPFQMCTCETILHLLRSQTGHVKSASGGTGTFFAQPQKLKVVSVLFSFDSVVLIG